MGEQADLILENYEVTDDEIDGDGENCVDCKFWDEVNRLCTTSPTCAFRPKD